MSITTGELVDKFKESGFYYSNELIFNYYNSLATKPFVILTGISGSGKSKIAQIFAEVISSSANKLFELIPIKPNWRDSKGLFGYHNLIDGSYYVTPLIQLFIRAINDPQNPYFLILDEMNIAKTEHYFADYLSLLESRRFTKIDKAKQITTIESNMKYAPGTRLSDAIILSAFHINKPLSYLEIREYRENIFSRLWREQLGGGGDPTSWTPQYRTELNQGDGRLAYRVFESPSGGEKYRLKQPSQLKPEDLATVKRLREYYDSLMNKLIEIKQENLTLHNCERCLSSESNSNCKKETCDLNPNEKYKCPDIYNAKTNKYLVPPQIPIPVNVFTIGTVNVDETTYMFSPKVLDRSNVIEFNDVNFNELYKLTDETKKILSNSKNFDDENFYFNKTKEVPALKVSLASPADVDMFSQLAKEQFADLLKIFNVLKQYNMHFGYRVMNEIALYICNINKNSEYANKNEIAFDLQILQKILPKINGPYEKLWMPLVGILNKCLKADIPWKEDISNDDLVESLKIPLSTTELSNLSLNKDQCSLIFKYPRTAYKILTMLDDLNHTGFATFIK